MLRLDAIRDPELLRQVAVLLERENDKLHARLQVLTAELARRRGDTTPAELELEFLKELLAQRERTLFGPSSERRPRPTPEEPPPPPAPRRGHGPTAQPKLPTIEVVHELAEADQTCPQCGGMLKERPGQTEDSDEIRRRRTAVRPRQASAEEIPLRVQRLHRYGAGSAAARRAP